MSVAAAVLCSNATSPCCDPPSNRPPACTAPLVLPRLYRHRSVLMGANIAADIARGELSECSIAYNMLDHAKLLQVCGGGV